MRGRVWLIVGALVLVVATALMVAHLTSPLGSSASGAVPATRTSTILPPLTLARAQALASALHSGNVTLFRSAVLLPVGQPLDATAVNRLASLRSIEFNSASFALSEPGWGLVRATTVDSAGRARSWSVAVIWSGGAWMVALSSPAVTS